MGARRRGRSKTWWRNLREPTDVELWLAGEHGRARARVVTGAEHPDECAAGLAAYLAAVPHAAAALGLPGDAGTRRAALSEVVGGVVLVRADLA